MDTEIRIVRKLEDLEAHCSPEEFAGKLSGWLAQWGDPPDQVRDALRYVFSDEEGKGGFLVLAIGKGNLVGALVMLHTGMGGYIPAHHLVYVAVSPEGRGRGLGGELVKTGMETAGGAVSLHIDRDNPARRLYERLGFSVKYLEMRTQGP